MSSTAEYGPWSPTGPASKEYPKASKSPVCIHWILLPKKSVALSRLTARTPCSTTAGPCPPWWVDPSPLSRKASFPGFPDFAGVFVGACKFFGVSSFTFGTTWADLEPNTFWVGVWSPQKRPLGGPDTSQDSQGIWETKASSLLVMIDKVFRKRLLCSCDLFRKSLKAFNIPLANHQMSHWVWPFPFQNSRFPTHSNLCPWQFQRLCRPSCNATAKTT